MNYNEKEKYFQANKHLQGIAPVEETNKKGLKAGETISGIIMNIEENSLDIIELYKENIKQKEQIEELKTENALLKKKFEEFEIKLQKIENK